MNGDYRVIIQPKALLHLDEIAAWIATSSPEAAQRWLRGVLEHIHTLQQFPRRCPLAVEASVMNMEIRQLLYGKRANKYRILYTIEDRTVNILHVRHARRQTISPEDL